MQVVRIAAPEWGLTFVFSSTLLVAVSLRQVVIVATWTLGFYAFDSRPARAESPASGEESVPHGERGEAPASGEQPVSDGGRGESPASGEDPVPNGERVESAVGDSSSRGTPPMDASDSQLGPASTPSLSPPPHWPSVKWSPVYRRYSLGELIVTASATAGLVTARVIGPPDEGPRGGVWIDEDVRDALRSPGYRGRLRAADVSDVLLGFAVSYSLLVDPLINASWLRKSPDVGIEVGFINAEVLAVTLGVQQITSNIVGRERPYGRTCGTEELDEDTHSCHGRDRYRSFFSGHTSVPFSLAAATCVHHAFIPLAGNKNWLSCSLGLLIAGSSGVLRMVADNHYATDVLTGAAFGTLVGLTIPLLHYARGNRWSAPPVAHFEMRVVPSLGGLSLQGRFL